MDLYDAKVVPSKEISFSEKIGKGKRELKIKCVGKNDSSIGFLFGLDYLQVQ